VSGFSRRQIALDLFYTTAVGALILDQVTKAVARVFLAKEHVVEVIPSFFSLRLMENAGAAFGLFESWRWVIVVVGILIAVIILRMRRVFGMDSLTSTGLGLMLGGSVGNLIDRLIPPHTVTDFLDFFINVSGRIYRWPTFNLADVAITVGVALFVLKILFRDRITSDGG
jgi:signal peptidase II